MGKKSHLLRTLSVLTQFGLSDFQPFLKLKEVSKDQQLSEDDRSKDEAEVVFSS